MDTKQKLFESYAANFSGYFPKVGEVFLCPICKQAFGRDSLSTETGPTIEHCIPQALGGRLLTLTCKACNNQAGTRLDAHLLRKLEADDFLQGISMIPKDAAVSMGEYRLKASVGFQGVENRLWTSQIIKRASNPASQAAVMKALYSGEAKSLKFHFNFGCKILNARIALIRIAFLLMFRQFGYGYVLCNSADILRSQLLNLNESQIPKEAIFTVNDNIAVVNRALIVQYPHEIRCFLMPVRLTTKSKSRVYGVLLPGFDNAPKTFYERLQDYVRIEQRFNIKVSPIRYDPRFLSGSQDMVTPHEVWEAYCDAPPKSDRLAGEEY